MNAALKHRPILNEDEAKNKLHAIGQEHILQYFHTLAPAQKENLLKQITHLDLDLFKREQIFTQPPLPTLEPFQTYSASGNENDQVLGAELVKDGKVALLVLAGGQGSRLRCLGPKGCRPITLIKHKSLFQLLAEKVKAASFQAGRHLEVAVMTSPLNYREIQTFFTQYAYFGLDPKQITFFYQRMWPFLNFEGNLFLETPDHIARGPNGNGSVFHRLVELDIWRKWEKMGIEMVNVIPIDNPLAAPFDVELFGFHKKSDCDVTVKAAIRRDAGESVGVLARADNKTLIVEYLDLTDEQKRAKDNEDNLKYEVANIGLYCLSMPFIQQVSKETMPLHRAKKSVKELTSDGTEIVPESPNAWKYEEFIFDAFQFADHVQALLFPRSSCFAPLKNLEGEDSISTVQEALLDFDRRIFAKVTGKEPPTGARFELAPQFYYPTQELLNKWDGQILPDKDYIDD